MSNTKQGGMILLGDTEDGSDAPLDVLSPVVGSQKRINTAGNNAAGAASMSDRRY